MDAKQKAGTKQLNKSSIDEKIYFILKMDLPDKSIINK